AIRELMMKELTRAGIARIELERAANKVDVTLFTAKPGIVIGKQGANVERLRKLIEKEVGKKVNLKIEEIKVPETNARLIAESIAEQITRRVAYRRAMKHAIQQAMRRGAKGVKVRMSGRLGGAEMSRTVTEMEGRVPLHTIRADIEFATVHAHSTYGRIGAKMRTYKGAVKGVKVRMSGRLGGAEMSRSVTEMEGRVPLHTIRADIEFATVHAHTTYGRIGVKVWVYKGDVMPQRNDVTAASLSADLANAGD